MSVGQTIKTVRRQRNLKTTDLNLPYSDSMLRKIESGERRVASDIAPIVATQLDHYAVLCELSREATAGFGPVYLNAIDGHRAVGKELGVLELQEAVDALMRTSTVRHPELLSDRERDRIRGCLMEVLDAGNICYNVFGSFCEQYGFSPLQLSRDHYSRLKAIGYVSE